MSVMIKLRLTPGAATFQSVRSLTGLKGLDLDARFGLVPISPKEQLYVVRVPNVDHIEDRKRQSPEILEAYGDIRISTT